METAELTQEPQRALRSHALTVAIAVATIHGLNDIYTAFLHPLLPRVMEKLQLNIALAATLAMTLSLAASLVQPVMGHFADRVGRRAFVLVGPVCCAVFLSLIGIAPNFAILIVFLVLGGLGSAAFHPPGASLAASSGHAGGAGTRYSIFTFGGAVGYAIGPTIAVVIASRYGLERLPYAALPMLIVAPIVFMLMPTGSSDRKARVHHDRPHVIQLLRGELGLIFGVSAVAAFVQRVFLTMSPIMIARAGGSEGAGAAMLGAYLGSQALGSVVGGMLADRVNQRTLLIWLTLLSLPAHLLLMWLPAGTILSYVVAAVAGMLNMAVMPSIVLMAQRLVPSSAALSAGIVMGLAWATGSIAMLGVGIIADYIGPQNAALAAMPVLLVGAAFATALPRR